VKLKKFADWLPNQVAAHWKRRDFQDFEYLQMELTETQLWWIMIILMIYNVAMSVWVINNEAENKFIPDAFSNGVDKVIQNVKNFFVNLYNKMITFVKRVKQKFTKDESNK
jgi:hypothetical protein